jgi:hypothetical protein
MMGERGERRRERREKKREEREEERGDRRREALVRSGAELEKLCPGIDASDVR